MKLTAAQQRTVQYVREHGPQLLGVLTGSGNGIGYNAKSAKALIRKGVLIEIEGPERNTTRRDGATETWRDRFAALPGQDENV